MSVLENLSDDPEYKKFLDHAETEMLPKMQQSAMCISIIDGAPDIKMCLEMGAALLLDKPIILVVLPGASIPVNLRRIASSIIEGDPLDPQVQEQLIVAIKDVVGIDASG